MLSPWSLQRRETLYEMTLRLLTTGTVSASYALAQSVCPAGASVPSAWAARRCSLLHPSAASPISGIIPRKVCCVPHSRQATLTSYTGATFERDRA